MQHRPHLDDHTATIGSDEPKGYEHNNVQYRHHAHCSCGWEGMFPNAVAAQRGLDGHEAVMATILSLDPDGLV